MIVESLNVAPAAVDMEWTFRRLAKEPRFDSIDFYLVNSSAERMLHLINDTFIIMLFKP